MRAKRLVTTAAVLLGVIAATVTVTTAAHQRSTQRAGQPAGDLTYTITGTLPSAHPYDTWYVGTHNLRLRAGVYRWHFVSTDSNKGLQTPWHATKWWLGNLAGNFKPLTDRDGPLAAHVCATNDFADLWYIPFSLSLQSSIPAPNSGLFVAGQHYGAPGDGVCTGDVSVMLVNTAHESSSGPLRYTLVLERIAAP